MTDGNHSFTATATDSSGNTSAASTVMAVIVDTVAPVIPTIALQSVDSGMAGDGITNVKVVSLTGVAEVNSTIKVYDGATLLGSAIANAEGVWNSVARHDRRPDRRPTAGAGQTGHVAMRLPPTRTRPGALPPGRCPMACTISPSTSTDAAGNVSATSAALNVTIDTVAPNAPVITGDTIVNTNQVLLSGTAEAGSNVALFEGVVQLGTATANGSGAWSFTTAALSNGTHVFTAKASDVAGNTSLASQSVSATIVTVIESFGSTSLTQIGSTYLSWQADRVRR